MNSVATRVFVLGAALLSACDASKPTTTDDANPNLVRRSAEGPSGDKRMIALMQGVNAKLASSGRNVRLNSIEYFTLGNGRPGDRLHQFDTRWVPGDPNRGALGNALRFLITTNRGVTASGLSVSQTSTAIRAALSTWSQARPLRSVPLVEVSQPTSGDPTFIDKLLFEGAFDDLPGAPPVFPSDIVYAGFRDPAFFEALVPGGASFILAFSPSLTFVDDNGQPLDSNGDNYIDVALNEVYFNNAWGNPSFPDPSDPSAIDPKDYPWGIDVDLPGIDVESIALHETGHSFQIGHFGAPPNAVMNPSYGGRLQRLLPTDLASMNPLWMRWPN